MSGLKPTGSSNLPLSATFAYSPLPGQALYLDKATAELPFAVTQAPPRSLIAVASEPVLDLAARVARPILRGDRND